MKNSMTKSIIFIHYYNNIDYVILYSTIKKRIKKLHEKIKLEKE